MPPSPALRYSPARDTQVDRHKRGRSLEIIPKATDRDKDDDLALFQDMQTKEKDSFLQHSGDDSDESLSVKLRDFSGYRLSISTPVHRERSDLLTNDTDKTDYDWLLTPPDTPLFPSLDDEAPTVNVSQRGRPRSQPIRVSRASRTETTSRASRSSASPRRSSPSSCSSSVNTFSRRRASPGPSASVSPTLRSLTPSVRPSTPTSKPSTPSVRSTTPTLRRSSPGSGGSGSVGRGASSSGKGNRATPSSPKLQSWHSNIPGFAAEPPPNLLTSISDRPIARTRGSSPASRRGLSPASRPGSETGNRSRRQSVSPTVSRSVSSSNSHDRDHFSSQSKGSAVSSCEDEMDSIQSAFSGKKRTSTVSMVNRPVTRKQETYANSRIQSFSKKPTRSTSTINISPSSVPKRSFDSALRQMDLRNTQSMFRPLLSSAPATSFYASKANSPQRRTYSINSSVTTSSNASSEQGAASVAPDTEGSDHDQDAVGKECDKSLSPHVKQEVFAIDKVDVKIEDSQANSLGCGRNQPEDPECNGVENMSSTTYIRLHARDNCDISEVKVGNSDTWNNGKVPVDISGNDLPTVMDDSSSDYCQNVNVSYTQLNDPSAGMVEVRVTDSDSRRKEAALIGNDYSADGSFVDIHEDLPANISSLNNNSDGTWEYLQAALLSDLETENNQKLNCSSSQNVFMSKSTEKQDIQTGSVPVDQLKSTENQAIQSSSVPIQRLAEREPRCMQDSNLAESAVGIGKQTAVHKSREANQQDNMSKLKGNESSMNSQSRDDTRCITGVPSHGSTSSMNLLNRANSCKWPIVHAKVVNATDLPDAGSQLRRSLNDLKTLRYEENALTSHSIDAGLTKQTETRVFRQSSSRRLDIDNFLINSTFKVPSGNFVPTTKAQSDTVQSPVYNEDSAMEVGIDSFVDVCESINVMQSGASDHATPAAEDRTYVNQSGGSENLKGRDPICMSLESVLPLHDSRLATEMDVNVDNMLASGIMRKEQCCQSDANLILEAHDQRHACAGNCDLSQNGQSSSEQAGENAFRDSKQAVPQPPEQDRERTENGCDLLLVRNDSSLQISTDVVISNDDSNSQERAADGLQESDRGFQTEAIPSLVDQSNSEMPIEPSTLATSEENTQCEDVSTKLPDPDSCKADPAHVSQEHTTKSDPPRGYLSRNLTLEEATDTILFCSSIVHNLAYKAVTIAMEKENPPIEIPRPMVTIVGKSEDHKNTCARDAARRTSKFQKIKSRQTAAHLQAPSNNVEINVKDHEAVMHVVTIPEKADTLKPLNGNSKCNCTIM